MYRERERRALLYTNGVYSYAVEFCIDKSKYRAFIHTARLCGVFFYIKLYV